MILHVYQQVTRPDSHGHWSGPICPYMNHGELSDAQCGLPISHAELNKGLSSFLIIEDHLICSPGKAGYFRYL